VLMGLVASWGVLSVVLGIRRGRAQCANFRK
jgi:hypothetical protein